MLMQSFQQLVRSTNVNDVSKSYTQQFADKVDPVHGVILGTLAVVVHGMEGQYCSIFFKALYKWLSLCLLRLSLRLLRVLGKLTRQRKLHLSSC